MSSPYWTTPASRGLVSYRTSVSGVMTTSSSALCLYECMPQLQRPDHGGEGHVPGHAAAGGGEAQPQPGPLLDTPRGNALYCTVLYTTVLHCTALYCTVLYCTALYLMHVSMSLATLYCTVLYCTVPDACLHVPGHAVLYCTALYCT